MCGQRDVLRESAIFGLIYLFLLHFFTIDGYYLILSDIDEEIRRDVIGNLISGGEKFLNQVSDDFFFLEQKSILKNLFFRIGSICRRTSLNF